MPCFKKDKDKARLVKILLILNTKRTYLSLKMVLSLRTSVVVVAHMLIYFTFMKFTAAGVQYFLYTLFTPNHR